MTSDLSLSGRGDPVACANQKGGVGKTTTVVNLATSLALRGRRVLVVDLDPQGNATSGLGLDRTAIDRSVYDVLMDQCDAAEALVATNVERLQLLPSSRDLAGVEVELVPLSQRERRLTRALDALLSRFDEILVDTPPSVGLLTVNALTAARGVLVPIQCEYYALEGLTQLLSTIDLVREHLNPTLELRGVVLTMFDGRTTLSSDVAMEVRRHLGDAVFQTVIPRSVRLAEAPSHGQPIALYRPDSKGAQAYEALATEYLSRATAPMLATAS